MVKGLDSLIKQNYPEVMEDVDIAVLAKEYQQRTGKTPVLLAHGFGCNIYMQFLLATNGIYLGQYKEFGKMILSFIDYCSKNGIECKFFFGGPIIVEIPEKWNSVLKLIEKSLYRLETGNCGRLRDRDFNLFATKGSIMNYYLRSHTASEQSTVFPEVRIMEYLAENGSCFGVLAKNDKYMFYEGIENYFNAEFLDPLKFTIRAFRRNKLAHALGIDEKYLPLLATLTGSCFVSAECLRKFHISLLRDHPNFRNFHYFHVKGQDVIPRISEWIRRNAHKFTSVDMIPKVAASLTRLIHLENDFEKSINSLVPSKMKQYINVESVQANKYPEEWAQILELAEYRHKFLAVDSNILAVVLRLKYCKGCGIEYFRKEKYPCSGVLLGKLRRRLYGILLKERPKSHGEPVVSEFVLAGENSLNAPLSAMPEFPALHPGLVQLWGDCSNDEKLRLLCWAVSDKLRMETVLTLPRNLRIASVTLFYLVNEAESGLLRWQVEAFVVHLIRLAASSVEDIRKLPLESPDVLEVHFGSVYRSSWFEVMAVDDACGNPLFKDQEDLVSFDGKIFNNVYNLMLRTAQTGSEICDTPDFSVIMNFLWN